MKKIFPLSPTIIAKIAAGEVIERPAYAIKELIENSLDAGATTIEIFLADAGLKKIIVTDNGEGMTPEDLKESFKLHTTSKISAEEHLAHIHTFGFRGEALASIAAVSNLTIQSKTKKQTAGTKIELRAGEIQNISPIGMPTGTIVTVTNLFYSIPARKKFLKTIRTEFRHILELITAITLANPQVHFSLKHNKKTIFDLPKTTNLLERVQLLLGTKLIAQLLPIEYQDNYIAISGYLAKPNMTTRIPNKQFIFINQRTISDKQLSLTIKNAYDTLLDKKAQPIFMLNVTLPYEFVDVNVHPRKEFVRFANSSLLTEAIHKSISQTLATHNLTFYAEQPFGLLLADSPKLTESFAGKLLKENQTPWDIRPRNEIGNLSEVIQIHNLYLLTQTRFGLMLVDQHAAHERILYEQFSEALQKEQKYSSQYHLSKPIILELSLADYVVLQEHLPSFAKLGFIIELFQDTTFLILAVPLIFQDRNIEQLIMEILQDVAENNKSTTIDENSKKLLSYLACRAAIKAGESLTKKQAKDLLEKLEQTSNNATCPHGRPTKIIIDIDQMHKMFKRK